MHTNSYFQNSFPNRKVSLHSGLLVCLHVQMILDTTSDMCALEIGGSSPWESLWEGKACMKQPLKALLQLPINPEKIFAYAPYFKPPGL
jgi:hypothetical protein